MALIIVITSGKGGVGKTTATANLGAALAMRGQKTLLIDGDTGLRNLDIAVGMESGIVYDLVDVVREECDYQKALLNHKSIEGLSILPTSQTREKADITKTQMRTLLRRIRPDFDFILIDCPAGIGQGFENAVAGADEAIIITTPELSCIRDADRIVALLEKRELTKMRLIINRLRPNLIKKGLMPGVEDVLNYLSVNLLGAVPEDEKVVVAANSDELVVTDSQSRAGLAFRNMAARLMGEEVPLIDFKERKNIFQRLFERA